MVVVGRCVNHVFKDRPTRCACLSTRPGSSVWKSPWKRSAGPGRCGRFLRKDDKRKQDYYRRFAGGVWNDAVNYDLCLNSAKLGFEKCGYDHAPQESDAWKCGIKTTGEVSMDLFEYAKSKRWTMNPRWLPACPLPWKRWWGSSLWEGQAALLEPLAG